MTKTTKLTVLACGGCPFYERSTMSIVADLLTKAPKKTGTCKHGGVGLGWPMGRFHVADEDKVPDRCPLREGPTHVELEIKK